MQSCNCVCVCYSAKGSVSILAHRASSWGSRHAADHQSSPVPNTSDSTHYPHLQLVSLRFTHQLKQSRSVSATIMAVTADGNRFVYLTPILQILNTVFECIKALATLGLPIFPFVRSTSPVTCRELYWQCHPVVSCGNYTWIKHVTKDL